MYNIPVFYVNEYSRIREGLLEEGSATTFIRNAATSKARLFFQDAKIVRNNKHCAQPWLHQANIQNASKLMTIK